MSRPGMNRPVGSFGASNMRVVGGAPGGRGGNFLVVAVAAMNLQGFIRRIIENLAAHDLDDGALEGEFVQRARERRRVGFLALSPLQSSPLSRRAFREGGGGGRGR